MLTDLRCRSAKPAAKAYKMADERGLYLYVTPKGARSWRLKYRFGGKEKRLTFGLYPDVLLSEAREQRDAARRLLRAGLDPANERRRLAAEAAAAAEHSFEALGREWHAHSKSRWNARYAKQILDRLENHVFPSIGGKPIADITPADVLRTIRTIEETGALEMAHRVRQHTSDIFVYAISTDRAAQDPAHVIQKALKPVPKRMHPAALKIEEARRVLSRVELQPAYRVTKLASRLLALTAARSGVLRLAEPREFEDLDGDAPIWRIPAEKMKLARERKADASFEFVIPLSTSAVETVKAAIALAGRKPVYLFPSVRTGLKPISNSTLSQLYLDSGFRGRHVPHGWRASFSTIMNEHVAHHGRDKDRAIIDLMLAHVPNGVEAAYNRAVYMPRRRELAQQWADMLMQAMPPATDLIGKG